MELPVTKPLTIEEYMLLSQREGRDSPLASDKNNRTTDHPDNTSDNIIKSSPGALTARFQSNIMTGNSHLQKQHTQNKNSCAQPVVSEGVARVPRLHDASTNNNASGYNYRSILPAQVLGLAPRFQYTPVMFKTANNPPVAERFEKAISPRGIVQTCKQHDLAMSPNEEANSGPQCPAKTTELLPQGGTLINEQTNDELATESPGFVITSVVGNYSANALDGGNEESHAAKSSPPPATETSAARNDTPGTSVSAAESSDKEKEGMDIRDGDSVDVDTLTETINRVAAGEGVIRQRFTPKVKRKTQAPQHKQGVRKVLISDTVDSTDSSTMCTSSANEEFKTFKEFMSKGLCMNHSLLMAQSQFSNVAHGSRDYRNIVKNENMTGMSELELSGSAEKTSHKSTEQSLVENTHNEQFSTVGTYTTRDETITHYLLKTPEKPVIKKKSNSHRNDRSNKCRAKSDKSYTEKDKFIGKVHHVTNEQLQIECDDKVPTLKDNTLSQERATMPVHREYQTEQAPKMELMSSLCNKDMIMAMLEKFKRISPNKKAAVTKQVTEEMSEGSNKNKVEVSKQIIQNEEKDIVAGHEDRQKASCSNQFTHTSTEKNTCPLQPGNSLKNTLAHGRPNAAQMPVQAKTFSTGIDESQNAGYSKQTVHTLENKMSPKQPCQTLKDVLEIGRSQTANRLAQHKSPVDDVKSRSPFRLALDKKETEVYVVPKLVKQEQKDANSDTAKCDTTDPEQCTPVASNDTRISFRHGIAKYIISNKNSKVTAKMSVMAKTNTLNSADPSVSDKNASVSSPQTCLKTTVNSTKTTSVGSQFSSKATVAQLLKARRLQTNKPKEIHVNNPLKLYGKIVNGEPNNKVSAIVKENKHAEVCRSKYVGVNVEPGDNERLCKAITCSEILATPESKIQNKTTKVSSSNVSVGSTTDNDQCANTGHAPQQCNLKFTLPKTSASRTRATGSQSNIYHGITSDNKAEDSNSPLSKTFSLKIGSEMYIVKPTKVQVMGDDGGRKQSPKVTLPAPKPKSSRKRQLSSEETERNKIIKNKIRRIKKSAIELQAKLAHALDLLPKRKKAKKAKKALRKLPLTSSLSLSLSSFSTTINSETAKMVSESSEKNKDSNYVDSSTDKTDTIKPIATDMKVSLTMLISKSFDGEFKYSIQRTKLNFVSKEHAEFHRWFEYSNYPSKLQFKEGMRLAQIDVETIKHGLYVIVSADKSLSELNPHVSATMSATLALYPAHAACIPHGSDALVIGQLVNSDGNDYVEPDTGTVDQLDNAEKLLNLVLGHQMNEDAEVFVDGRYSSVSATMSPRCHSPRFYTHAMQAYFSDTQSASDCGSTSVDVRVDKRPVSRSSSTNSVVVPEASMKGACMNMSEKAMALKLKQQKLIESCQKLKQSNQAKM